MPKLVLIEVVNELGEDVNTNYSKLEVIDVRPFSTYEIKERDGREYLEYDGRSEPSDEWHPSENEHTDDPVI